MKKGMIQKQTLMQMKAFMAQNFCLNDGQNSLGGSENKIGAAVSCDYDSQDNAQQASGLFL